MATRRKAVVIYDGNASQSTYAFPFDYLRKAFVKVEDISTFIKELEYGTDYTVTDKEITLVNPIATGHSVKIYRETTTDPLVEWQDASVLRATDMSLQEIQLLHIVEEALGTLEDNVFSLSETESDAWDARFRRIINLLDPQEDGDAVTLRFLKANQSSYINELKDAAQKLLDQINETGGEYNVKPLVNEMQKLLAQTKAYAEWADTCQNNIMNMLEDFQDGAYYTKQQSDARYLYRTDIVACTEADIDEILKGE